MSNYSGNGISGCTALSLLYYDKIILPIGGILSTICYIYLFWMYFVVKAPILMRHPTALAIYKCIFEFSFVQQYLWLPFINTQDFYLHNQGCKANTLAAILSFLTQFSMLASIGCFLIISFDLRVTYTNPFLSNRKPMLYLSIVVMLVSLITALILVAIGPDHYGLSTNGTVWIQQQYDLSVNNVPISLLYFIPAGLCYLYCGYTYLLFRNTVMNLRSVMNRSRKYVFGYLFIGVLVWGLELLAWIFNANNYPYKRAVLPLAAYIYCFHGVWTTLIIMYCNWKELSWKHLNPFNFEQKQVIILTGRNNNDNSTLNNTVLSDSNFLEQIARESVNLHLPYLNKALRAEVLYFTVQGILHASEQSLMKNNTSSRSQNDVESQNKRDFSSFHNSNYSNYRSEHERKSDESENQTVDLDDGNVVDTFMYAFGGLGSDSQLKKRDDSNSARFKTSDASHSINAGSFDSMMSKVVSGNNSFGINNNSMKRMIQIDVDQLSLDLAMVAMTMDNDLEKETENAIYDHLEEFGHATPRISSVRLSQSFRLSHSGKMNDRDSINVNSSFVTSTVPEIGDIKLTTLRPSGGNSNSVINPILRNNVTIDGSNMNRLTASDNSISSNNSASVIEGEDYMNMSESEGIKTSISFADNNANNSSSQNVINNNGRTSVNQNRSSAISGDFESSRDSTNIDNVEFRTRPSQAMKNKSLSLDNPIAEGAERPAPKWYKSTSRSNSTSSRSNSIDMQNNERKSSSLTLSRTTQAFQSFFLMVSNAAKISLTSTYNEFRFRDFLPKSFMKLKQLYGITIQDYIKSFTKIENEKFSEGRSGSFMFHTSDLNYIVKSMSLSDVQSLKSILKEYIHYIENNPKSLIVRFVGLHSITMYGQDLYFVVMLNQFAKSKNVNNLTRYDLKGSWINRYAGEKHKNNKLNNLLMMDNDLQPHSIAFQSELTINTIASQIKKDVEFLK
eukprot:gene16219-22064_t